MFTSEAVGFVPNPWDTPRGVAEKTHLTQKHPETRKKAKQGPKKKEMRLPPQMQRIITPPHKRVVALNHGPSEMKRKEKLPRKREHESTNTNARQCSSLPGAKTNYDMHRTDLARRTRFPSIECTSNIIAHPDVGLLVSELLRGPTLMLLASFCSESTSPLFRLGAGIPPGLLEHDRDWLLAPR